MTTLESAHIVKATPQGSSKYWNTVEITVALSLQN